MKSYRIFIRADQRTLDGWTLRNYTTDINDALHDYVDACLEYGKDNVSFCTEHDVRLSLCSVDEGDGALQDIRITPSVEEADNGEGQS